MNIHSDAFINNGTIPVQYTCNGASLQPPLKISDVPGEARGLALLVHDPDAPAEDGFVHWVVWNIDPKTSVIENGKTPDGAVEGATGKGVPGWVAPCPPTGIHHYNFKLYALDTSLAIPPSSDKSDLMAAMDKHILESATLTGLYGK